RYATGQDMVLLVGEVISVTNAPIADLEVFVSSTGPFKVATNGLSSFVYEVVNNGDGALGGYADGDVILTGNMPNGITINTITATDWNCALQTATAFTCIFQIADDLSDSELNKDEYLPTVSVSVNIANDSVFTQLDNDITTVGRLSHVGD